MGLTQAEAERYAKQAGFEVRFEIVAAPGTADGVVLSQDPGGLAVRETGTILTVRVAGTKSRVAEAPPAPVAPPRAAAAPPPSEPPPSEPPAPSAPTTEAPPSGTIPELPPTATEPPPAAPVPAEPVPSEPAPAAPGVPGLGDLPAEPGLDLTGPPLPNTFGMSRQEAERALSGYQLFMEVTLTSADMQGRVVEQHPEPGQPLSLGQPVTLIFGLANEPGPQYRQVPALEGVTPEEAAGAAGARRRLRPGVLHRAEPCGPGRSRGRQHAVPILVPAQGREGARAHRSRQRRGARGAAHGARAHPRAAPAGRPLSRRRLRRASCPRRWSR